MNAVLSDKDSAIAADESCASLESNTCPKQIFQSDPSYQTTNRMEGRSAHIGQRLLDKAISKGHRNITINYYAAPEYNRGDTIANTLPKPCGSYAPAYVQDGVHIPYALYEPEPGKHVQLPVHGQRTGRGYVHMDIAIQAESQTEDEENTLEPDTVISPEKDFWFQKTAENSKHVKGNFPDQSSKMKAVPNTVGDTSSRPQNLYSELPLQHVKTDEVQPFHRPPSPKPRDEVNAPGARQTPLLLNQGAHGFEKTNKLGATVGAESPTRPPRRKRTDSIASAPGICQGLHEHQDTLKQDQKFRREQKINKGNPQTFIANPSIEHLAAPLHCQSCTQACQYVIPYASSNSQNSPLPVDTRKSAEIRCCEEEFVVAHLKEIGEPEKYYILDVYDSPTSPYLLLYYKDREVLRFPIAKNKKQTYSITPDTKYFKCLCKLEKHYMSNNLPAIGVKLGTSAEIKLPQSQITLDPSRHKTGVYEIIPSPESPVAPFTLRVVVNEDISSFPISVSHQDKQKDKLTIGADCQLFSCRCELVQHFQEKRLPRIAVNLTKSLRQFIMTEKKS